MSTLHSRSLGLESLSYNARVDYDSLFNTNGNRNEPNKNLHHEQTIQATKRALASRRQAQRCFDPRRPVHRHSQPNRSEARAPLQFEKGGHFKNTERLRSSKLPPNPKMRINSILDHFSNMHARVRLPYVRYTFLESFCKYSFDELYFYVNLWRAAR